MQQFKRQILRTKVPQIQCPIHKHHQQKKKKITQHKNMEGLNKKQNPIWQSREERERERTCVSAGCTVGFGPNGFSSILPHPVKYIWFATGPNYKTP